MALRKETLIKDLLKRFGRLGVEHVRPKIVSVYGKPIRELQRALSVVSIDRRSTSLYIPHYWAVYVHDGRRAPFGPRRGTFLIWWKDPRQDPRLAPFGGVTPQRASQLRRLTQAQFRAALELRRQALAEGRDSPVVIVPEVRKPTRAVRFFDNRGGMRGFLHKANAEGQVLVRQEILRSLSKELGVTSFIPRLTAGQGVTIKPKRETVRLKL